MGDQRVQTEGVLRRREDRAAGIKQLQAGVQEPAAGALPTQRVHAMGQHRGDNILPLAAGESEGAAGLGATFFTSLLGRLRTE